MDERVRQSDQAFWDAAACAALGATDPTEVLNDDEYLARRAARCADALLEERRKRQAAREGT